MKIEVIEEPESGAPLMVQRGAGAVLYVCPRCGYAETHGPNCKISCPECAKHDEEMEVVDES